VRIAVVCLGNICRSPMAEVVLRERLDEAGLTDVELVSAGTGDWHIGERMDRRAAATLRGAGYDSDRHRAKQWPVGDLASYDLVLAMDQQNLADLLRLAGDDEVDAARVRLFRDFDPDGAGLDVPDPYYGGNDGFTKVLEIVERTSDALVGRLVRDRAEVAER